MEGASCLRVPKKGSIKLFSELAQSYVIRNVCDLCLGLTAEGNASIRNDDHKCFKDRLVLEEKSQNGKGCQIRTKPSRLRLIAQICDHVKNNENCPERQRCPWPHSELELMLWEREINDEISIASFIEDLRDTSLEAIYFVEHLCSKHNGSFKLACSRCYN